MTQCLRIPSNNAIQREPLSFCPQQRELLAPPSRIGYGGGAAFAKPQAAYAPFSLGFRDFQPKKPQSQAHDIANIHPAQAQAAQVQTQARDVSTKIHPVRVLPVQVQTKATVERANRPPEKNTFIHFDVPDSRVSTLTKEQIERWGSAPCIMQTGPYTTKFPQMETAHVKNECKPCAYHFQKVDGCRWGDQCTFCHLCPTGEIKRRKKEKVRAIKGQRSKHGARTQSDQSDA